VTAADVVVACGLALAAAYLLASGGSAAPGTRVEITSSRGETLSFDLRETRTIEVEGARGTTVIAIEDGGVRFIASPCPHKTCLGRGRISRCGEWIACVPNGVVASLKGKRAYDGITP
jgi:hypothetical protein